MHTNISSPIFLLFGCLSCKQSAMMTHSQSNCLVCNTTEQKAYFVKTHHIQCTPIFSFIIMVLTFRLIYCTSDGNDSSAYRNTLHDEFGIIAVHLTALYFLSLTHLSVTKNDFLLLSQSQPLASCTPKNV